MADDAPSVCVVTQPLSAAGERISRNFLEILSAVTCVSLMTGNVPEDSGLRREYEVIEISDAGTGDNLLVAAVRFLRNQVRMARALRRRDEDVVVFFGPTSYLLPIVASKLAGKTVVLLPRGDVPLTLRIQWEERVPAPLARSLAGAVWLLERAGYRLADAIVTYTPSMARELGLERYGAKLYTNGARYVDTERFAPRVPFGERDRVVGFVGRLDEEKGIRALAEAARHLPEDVTFRFVGDGDLRGWLERELAEERAAGRVEVVGWVDNEAVPEELNRLRLLVLPSAPTEGLPTVILEAMACGTPALATPVSGVPDVVKDGDTGLLFDRDDDLSERIEAALEGDLEAMSGRARELAEAEYSFEAAVERYRAILSAIDAAD